MGARLSIRSLGLLEVELDGRALPGLSGGKMSALLMLLAARPGHRHRRDALADLLWPDLSAPAARANLRHAFFHLRESLGGDGREPFLLSGRDWLGFNPESDFWLDAVDLAAAAPKPAGLDLPELERRAKLYRGEFMADFSLPDCRGFEDWLEAQRQELRRQALALMEYLADHHERTGQYTRGLEFARRLSELDPLDEAAHCRVMRLCACCGHPAAAQAQFEACRAVLWKELGAQPSEETRALLRQVLRDKTQSAGRLRASEETPALPAPPTERRQVTVLYCELTLANVEDADDAAEQLHGPQRRCVDIVRQHGGHVRQSHGGGLLAYFGYPDAREDAARRAIDAARAMCQVAAPAVARCGVHTGLIATAPGLQAPDVVGRTSELASRLRLAAGEGGVALSQEAFQLVESHVPCIHLGTRVLLNDQRPVAVYRIEGAGGPRREPAQAARSPFFGREEEIRRLRSDWRRACAGEPAAVLVRGDPGIGKSRLVAQLRMRVIDEDEGEVLATHCAPEHQGTPFFALRFALRVDPPPAQPSLAAEAQRRRFMSALLENLLELAERRPLLAVVEDVQWADSSTLELLQLLIARLSDQRILVLLTSRAEFALSRPAPRLRVLELQHLPDKPSRQLAAALTAALPVEALERIVALADGVPLFIEELARWRGAPSTIPATLQDLLMARIDQLGGARRLAQVGAACGRDFDPKLLGEVLRQEGVEVAQGLQDLLRSGLVLEVKGRLLFKHRLIQEAAYQSQSRSVRRETHRRIAAVLRREFPRECQKRPEVLAHHLTESGEAELAIRSWRAAGDAAAESWSHVEAVLHYRKALELVALWAPGPERDKAELQLRVALGVQLIPATGFGSPQTRECYERAFELCRGGEDAEQLFRVVYGQWMSSSATASYVHAHELAERLSHLAGLSGRAEFALAAHVALAITLFWMGRYADTSPHVTAARMLVERVDLEAYLRTFGVEPLVYAQAFFGLSRWFLGFPNEALRAAEEAMAAAARAGQARGRCVALCLFALLARTRRRPQQVLDHCEALDALAKANRMPFWTAAAKSLRGWALAMQGNAHGAELSLQGLSEVRENMAGAEVMFGLVHLEALAALGHHGRVLREADALLDAARRRCDEHATPEIHRLKGEALLAAAPASCAAAEACLGEALEQARRSGARMLELRAAMSLFRSRRDSTARCALEAVAARFGRGEDCPDVLDARRLLSEDERGLDST